MAALRSADREALLLEEANYLLVRQVGTLATGQFGEAQVEAANCPVAKVPT